MAPGPRRGSTWHALAGAGHFATETMDELGVVDRGPGLGELGASAK